MDNNYRNIISRSVYYMGILFVVAGCQAEELADKNTNHGSIDQDLKRELSMLRKINKVYTSVHGPGRDVLRLVNHLKAKSNICTLMTLLQDESAAVRVYAFKLLCDTLPIEKMITIFKSNIDDKELVEVVSGDFGYGRKVGDLYVQILKHTLFINNEFWDNDNWDGNDISGTNQSNGQNIFNVKCNNNDDPDALELNDFGDFDNHDQNRNHNRKLTAEFKQRLCNILITIPNQLDSRKRAIETVGPTPRYKNRIRELALKDADGTLSALAKYHDPDDIPLLLKKMRLDSIDSIRAIGIFPHDAFYTKYVRLHKKLLMGNYTSSQIETYYCSALEFGLEKSRCVFEKLLAVFKDDIDKIPQHQKSAFKAIVIKYKHLSPQLEDRKIYNTVVQFSDIALQFLRNAHVPYLSGWESFLLILDKVNRKQALAVIEHRLSNIKYWSYCDDDSAIEAMVDLVCVRLGSKHAHSLLRKALMDAQYPWQKKNISNAMSTLNN